MSSKSDVDLLVLGVGRCGLGSALAAGRLGASVALVEKYGQLGGHTNATSAMIPAAGTSFQKEKDIPDNPEIFMSNVIKRNNGICDLNQVRALCYASSDLVEWLRYECGISLELVLDFNYTGHTYYRMHTTPTV